MIYYNVYFEKTLHIIFNNLKPKYIDIEHKVSPGESFNSILTKHEIPLKEINKIKKELAKKNNLKKLKTNQIIKFTVDVSDSKKIITFLYPVSRTKKIKIERNLVNDNFNYQEIITDLNKKLSTKKVKYYKVYIKVL